MADQDRLFLTSEVSLTKEPTGFVPSMTLERIDFTDSLLAAEGTYTVTSDPIHGFAADSLGTAAAGAVMELHGTRGRDGHEFVQPI